MAERVAAPAHPALRGISTSLYVRITPDILSSALRAAVALLRRSAPLPAALVEPCGFSCLIIYHFLLRIKWRRGWPLTRILRSAALVHPCTSGFSPKGSPA